MLPAVMSSADILSYLILSWLSYLLKSNGDFVFHNRQLTNVSHINVLPQLNRPFCSRPDIRYKIRPGLSRQHYTVVVTN
jgi:hypothetical protein